MNYDYKPFSAFAPYDGAIVGAMWITSFLCFIGEFNAPLLSFVAVALGIGSVFVAYARLRRFRDGVLNGRITFGRAMLYSVMVYFYAAVLMAVGQYVYFQFFDHGYLVNQYIQMLSVPEYAATVKNVYGIEAKQLVAILQTSLLDMRAIEIVFQFLSLNFFLSLVLSVPAGALARRG